MGIFILIIPLGGMVRKGLAIFILFVGQLIMLAHSLVLHHHEDVLSGVEHHVGDQEMDDEHPSDDSINIDFSDFVHAGEQATFTTSERVLYSTIKNFWQPIIACVPDYSDSHDYVIEFQHHTLPSKRVDIYRSFYRHCFSLRGPPIVIVV